MAARSPDGASRPAIDSHAHVSMEDFDADRDGVLERARAARVQFVEIGFDPDSSRKAVWLAKTLRGICSVGIHPHTAADRAEGPISGWKEIESLLNPGNPEIAAIGEIGLDYYRDLVPKEIQMECFLAGLELARKKALPVVIHRRDSGDDAFRMVRRAGLNRPIIFHCFSGDAEDLKKCLDLNGFVGLGGVLTYPKNSSLRETVRSVPPDRFLLETDCPYLAPQSRRGKRNEPAFVLEVAHLVAELLALPVPRILQASAQNAQAAFMADPTWKSN